MPYSRCCHTDHLEAVINLILGGLKQEVSLTASSGSRTLSHTENQANCLQLNKLLLG